MAIRELLLETFAFMPPGRALAGLSAEDASRRVPGASHSIAEIVAHVDFWQAWLLKRCQGIAEPMAESAAAGWPPASLAGWDRLRTSFLDGLELASSLGDDPARLELPVSPAIGFPPLANYTVRDALVHVATHNAHHLGQVITLRQLLGSWPPPSGSWTW